MVRLDLVKRYGKSCEGINILYFAERYKCKSCGHIVRILPSEIFLPYKHYMILHIQSVLNRNKRGYPSAENKTLVRWWEWYRNKYEDILFGLAVYFKMSINPLKTTIYNFLYDLKKRR